MYYLKIFQNHSGYEDFVEEGTMLKPNVSHCIEENEVHYNPIAQPLVVRYNVIDASQQTKLYNYDPEGPTAALMFDNVEIDGADVSIADLDAASGQRQFSVGEHIVKYTLKDPTSVTRYIFYECSGLTSVTIPNSVTSIGEGAFQECRGLISMTIGNSVTSIGEYAFYRCTSLTSVTIPNSVTFIGDYAFYRCVDLTSVAIGNSVTSIGISVFEGCTGIASITIPNSMTSIGVSAFRSCSNLASVNIGSSMTSIGSNAFSACSSLTSVNIPNSVTSIGDNAFCGTNLDEMTQGQITAINPNGLCSE